MDTNTRMTLTQVTNFVASATNIVAYLAFTNPANVVERCNLGIERIAAVKAGTMRMILAKPNTPFCQRALTQYGFLLRLESLLTDLVDEQYS